MMSIMMVHGYNANDLLSSTVISIPKNTRGERERERERERDTFIKINRKHDDTCTHKNYNVD